MLQRTVEVLKRLFDKYVGKVLEFRRKNCRELVPTSHLNAASSLCYLLDALATPENGVRREGGRGRGREGEREGGEVREGVWGGREMFVWF